MTDNLTNKISDLKKLAEERKQLTISRKGNASPSRQATTSAPLLERPASRVEIHSLEQELEERVRLVLDSSNFQRNPNEFGLEFAFQPQKENMMLTRERMLGEMNATVEDLEHEPWLDSYVKCECLKLMCDEVSSRFADMLGVNSTELGSVARKLRLTYKQSFEQMAISWKSIRKQFIANESELENMKKQLTSLQRRLDNKENEISAKFDEEVIRISREYQEEKERDKEKLAQAETKMDQMADTLKYLNGIFRAMQNDTATLKTSDLHTLASRLTKENEELKKEKTQLDSVKTQLYSALNKIKTLEATIRTNQEDTTRLNIQLQRREEVINHLMEKDTIRNAEIEKLQRISKMKDEEILAMDMKDVATSVLCIKCKKSLDDITNIRSTLMLENANNPGGARLQCEHYRILLPNLRNRKPNRTIPWIRSVIRSLLLSKMKEDMSLHYLKWDSMTFPAFVYAWFRRNTDGITGTALTKLLVLCDEDRWGLYYGAKALHKEDSECSLFWSLLDETFGQDGLRFVSYCFSVILSIGGKALWRQFGSSMTHDASINVKMEDDNKIAPNIYIDISTAKDGVTMILTKALAPHLSDALDSIDALKVKPDDLLPDHIGAGTDENNPNPTTTTVRIVSDEPTHINLFTWLRIMLQQFHADQIHRNAAIRLMFETASVGAMTSANPAEAHSPANRGKGGNNNNSGAAGAAGGNVSHVEYPQFQSICQTLFPHMSVTEICYLYARCHHAGKRRVTADIFTHEADCMGLFAQSLKLPTLPLLKQLNLKEEINRLEGNENTISSAPITLVFPNSPNNGNINSSNAMDATYSKRTLFTIRSKLATVIHRRFAGLLPGIRYMMRYIPERWKVVLVDAIDNTNLALNDSFQKLKELNKHFSHAPSASSLPAISADTGKNSKQSGNSNETIEKILFLDGVQPYLHYRRLLSIVVLIQSLMENPFLPTELFSAVVIQNNEENIEKAVLRLERTIESLESVIFSPADMEVVNIPKRILNKHERFQKTRKIVIIRRIQNVFRKFMSKEVPIPRSVRMVMAAGYLTNTIHQQHLLVNDNAQPLHATSSSATAVVPAGSSTTGGAGGGGKFYSVPLKYREVYHEPWWGQANIANIYLYKISYDIKAAQLGKEPITLPQAISSYFYCLFGSTDVAERSIQDLFVAIKAYRFNLPRLRLFGCFLGDGRDMEENIVDILYTSEAVSIYFSLLFAIHRQLAKKREYMLKLAINSASASFTGTGAGTKIIKAGNACKQFLSFSFLFLLTVIFLFLFPLLIDTIIETLFPSTENTFQHKDKKEIWLMEADLLTAAAKAWASQQQWLRGQVNVFSDLPEKLRPDVQNRVDVDDFLWIMMIQWAKLESSHVKKCLARGSLIEKSVFGPNVGGGGGANANPHNPNSQVPPTPKGTATPSSSTGPVNDSQQQQGPHSSLTVAYQSKEGYLSRRLSVLPLTNLKSIVESIYRPEDGDNLADIQHYASSYIKLIRSRRAVLPQVPEAAQKLPEHMIARRLQNVRNLDTKFGSELSLLLRECVLWDTNLSFVDSPATPEDQMILTSRKKSGLMGTTRGSFIGRTSLAAMNLEALILDSNNNAEGKEGGETVGKLNDLFNRSSSKAMVNNQSSNKSMTSNGGGLSPVEDGEKVPLEEMVSFYSSATIKLSHFADLTILGQGSYPELIMTMCKNVFVSYQVAISSFLDKVISLF
jgi:hypothetical protein